jgi:hypothetical protein
MNGVYMQAVLNLALRFPVWGRTVLNLVAVLATAGLLALAFQVDYRGSALALCVVLPVALALVLPAAMAAAPHGSRAILAPPVLAAHMWLQASVPLLLFRDGMETTHKILVTAKHVLRPALSSTIPRVVAITIFTLPLAVTFVDAPPGNTS